MPGEVVVVAVVGPRHGLGRRRAGPRTRRPSRSRGRRGRRCPRSGRSANSDAHARVLQRVADLGQGVARVDRHDRRARRPASRGRARGSGGSCAASTATRSPGTRPCARAARRPAASCGPPARGASGARRRRRRRVRSPPTSMPRRSTAPNVRVGLPVLDHPDSSSPSPSVEVEHDPLRSRVRLTGEHHPRVDLVLLEGVRWSIATSPSTSRHRHVPQTPPLHA